MRCCNPPSRRQWISDSGATGPRNRLSRRYWGLGSIVPALLGSESAVPEPLGLRINCFRATELKIHCFGTTGDESQNLWPKIFLCIWFR